MKTQITLKGLDCPHCSAEIEREVGSLDFVSSASVNLINERLTVETSTQLEEKQFNTIENIVHKHEPDVKVILDVEEHAHEHGHDHDHEHEHGHSHGNDSEIKIRIVRLSVGAVVFAIGMILPLVAPSFEIISLVFLVIAYGLLGYDVVLRAVRNITKGKVFDENFLMALSTIGAFVISKYSEAVAVMLFYQIGELFQDIAVGRSRKSISSLLDIRPDSATLKNGSEYIVVPAEQVSIGSEILVKPGERVPLDGIILSGKSSVDTRALTGESVPETVNVGDEVLSGCINLSGAIEIKTTKSFGDSTASKIIELVQNATTKKAPAENFISKFAHYYTPIVVISALLLAVLPPVLGAGEWSEWIYRGFVFLVISCPCALVISIPLTFFGGLGAASRKGILIKGSNYLEALNNLENVVFDKTGTLTKGTFKVTSIIPSDNNKVDDILKYAAAAEVYSNHPIANSVLEAFKETIGDSIDSNDVSDYSEILGKGVSASYCGSKIFAGNAALMDDLGIDFQSNDDVGTKLFIAKDNKYIGCIVIADEIKEDTKSALLKLKESGIKKLVMLTGDNKSISDKVSKALPIDEYRAELLPSDKVTSLEEIMINSTKNTAFVGDGINDAPVLARADVGIAMGALGSDAAIEAADIVLMTDELSKLSAALNIAQKTKKIVTQNIAFALGIKAILLVLGAIGISGMWAAIFGDVGVMIIAVINSMRMIKIK